MRRLLAGRGAVGALPLAAEWVSYKCLSGGCLAAASARLAPLPRAPLLATVGALLAVRQQRLPTLLLLQPILLLLQPILLLLLLEVPSCRRTAVQAAADFPQQPAAVRVPGLQGLESGYQVHPSQPQAPFRHPPASAVARRREPQAHSTCPLAAG